MTSRFERSIVRCRDLRCRNLHRSMPTYAALAAAGVEMENVGSAADSCSSSTTKHHRSLSPLERRPGEALRLVASPLEIIAHARAPKRERAQTATAFTATSTDIGRTPKVVRKRESSRTKRHFPPMRTSAPRWLNRLASTLEPSAEAWPSDYFWLVVHRALRNVPRVDAVWTFFRRAARRVAR